jgi:hypothetical protein
VGNAPARRAGGHRGDGPGGWKYLTFAGPIDPKRGKRSEVTEMGWDRGRYYTRSKKVNGRVVREYFGAGRVGQIMAEMDAVEREERRLAAEARLEEKADLARLDAEVRAVCVQIEQVARAALRAAGYRLHKRGEWRKTRGRTTTVG